MVCNTVPWVSELMPKLKSHRITVHHQGMTYFILTHNPCHDFLRIRTYHYRREFNSYRPWNRKTTTQDCTCDFWVLFENKPRAVLMNLFDTIVWFLKQLCHSPMSIQSSAPFSALWSFDSFLSKSRSERMMCYSIYNYTFPVMKYTPTLELNRRSCHI